MSYAIPVALLALQPSLVNGEPKQSGIILQEPVSAPNVIEEVSGMCMAGSFAIRLRRETGDFAIWRSGNRVDSRGAEKIGKELKTPSPLRIGVSCDRKVVVVSIWWVRFAEAGAEYKSARMMILPDNKLRVGPIRVEDPGDFARMLRAP